MLNLSFQNKVPLALHSHYIGLATTQTFLNNQWVKSLGESFDTVHMQACSGVSCFNIIYDVTEKDPCTRMVVTDPYGNFGYGYPISNFSFSVNTCQKQAKTSQHFGNKSLVDVTCIPVLCILCGLQWTTECKPLRERFLLTHFQVSNCTESQKGHTLLTYHRVVHSSLLGRQITTGFI